MKLTNNNLDQNAHVTFCMIFISSNIFFLMYLQPTNPTPPRHTAHHLTYRFTLLTPHSFSHQPFSHHTLSHTNPSYIRPSATPAPYTLSPDNPQLHAQVPAPHPRGASQRHFLHALEHFQHFPIPRDHLHRCNSLPERANYATENR